MAETTVTSDMDQAGTPRQPETSPLPRTARRYGRDKHERRREVLSARARALGFASLAAYLTEREHEWGWRRADIARELGSRAPPRSSAL